MAALAAVAALSLGSGAAHAGVLPSGNLLFSISRSDDKLYPENAFYGEISVEVNESNAPSIQEVRVVITPDEGPAGNPIILEQEVQDGVPQLRWTAENEWPDLASMKSDLDGNWVVTLDLTDEMSTDVVSNFDVFADTFSEGDFYPSPTITNPTHLEAGVAPDTTLTWDATGVTSPYVLIVELENDSWIESEGDREDDSLQGDILIGATSWDPDGGLLPGLHEFAVLYFVDARTFIGEVTVTEGIFEWVLSPLAQDVVPPYPNTKPLLALGSESIIQFSVPVVEDFESYSIQTDAAGRTIMDGGESVRVYFLVDGGGDEIVSVSQALASSAGNSPDPFEHLSWSLISTTGQTETVPLQDGLVLLGDLPAFSDRITGGPFSGFFGRDPASRSPKYLWDAWISISAREATQAQASSYRVLLTDSSGNQAATNEIPLGGVFQEQQLHVTNEVFSNPGAPGENLDFTQVVGISVALFTAPGSETPALIMRVDEVGIEFVPEPGAWQLGLAAVGALGVVARRRRRTS